MEIILPIKKLIMSRIYDKISKLTDYLSAITKNMNYSQRNYTKKLVEEILNMQLKIEAENTFIKSKLAGISKNEYDSVLDQSIKILQILGVTYTDMSSIYKNDIITVIHKLKQKIGKIDIERLNNLCEIVNYYLVTRGKPPETISDLKEITVEIKELRNSDIDIDKRIEEFKRMSRDEINQKFDELCQ